MRRNLTTLAIFLLLGAVLNVAVAWSCAVWSPLHWDRGSSSVGDLRERWRAAVDFDTDRWHMYVRRAFGLGCRHTAICQNIEYALGPGTDAYWIRYEMVFCQAGWPLPCAEGWRRELKTTTAWLTPFAWERLGVQGRRIVPLRPLWMYATINTFFYATILWLLVRGPVVLRRMIRQRRGRCPACGYLVGVSPVCTECGQTVPRIP